VADVGLHECELLLRLSVAGNDIGTKQFGFKRNWDRNEEIYGRKGEEV